MGLFGHYVECQVSAVLAVVNPVWAACILNEFVPERVHLLKNEKIEGNVQTVKNWLTSILECFGVCPEFYEHDADEDNMDSFARTLISVVKSEVGNEVAVDKTFHILKKIPKNSRRMRDLGYSTSRLALRFRWCGSSK